MTNRLAVATPTVNRNPYEEVKSSYRNNRL